MSRIFLAGAFVFVSVLAPIPKAFSASVVYQGYLYDLHGLPVFNGRVIAGTFKPRFDTTPLHYWCTYGDMYCNLNPNNYAQAVADGNFIPLNDGVLTNPFGFFQGSGTTNAVGSQIWLFGFSTPQPVSHDLQQALASSSNSSYTVPASGTMMVDANLANTFILGTHFSNGISFGITPFPEPTALCLAMLAIAGISSVRSRR